MGWVLFGVVVVVFAAIMWRILRSFRRWPPTQSERRSFIWARRGGGDM
jgi:hypothetical protein